MSVNCMNAVEIHIIYNISSVDFTFVAYNIPFTEAGISAHPLIFLFLMYSSFETKYFPVITQINH